MTNVPGYKVIQYLKKLEEKEKIPMNNERKFFIAGVVFRGESAINAINELEIGDELILKPEPENEFDSNAIAIYSGEVHLGYVPKKFSAELAAALEITDYECIVEVINPKEKPWKSCAVVVRPSLKDESDYSFGDEGMYYDNGEEG
jgi:hypothetical protein